MATSMNVGQKLPITIQFLDQNGNPMAPTPVPDAPPTWTNSNNTVGTLVVASDALSAEEDALTAGATTVGMTLAVAGVSFTASLDVTVAAAAQVLTSVVLVPGTPA